MNQKKLKKIRRAVRTAFPNLPVTAIESPAPGDWVYAMTVQALRRLGFGDEAVFVQRKNNPQSQRGIYRMVKKGAADRFPKTFALT